MPGFGTAALGRFPPVDVDLHLIILAVDWSSEIGRVMHSIRYHAVEA